MIRIGVHDWRVIVGYGHAPEHASLYCADIGVLIAGDMLLPRISTNVSAYASAPLLDMLGAYLESIDRLTELPEDTLVLPSHGRPFRGIHARVAELHAHHAARCDDLLAACTGNARCAGELLTVLFGRPIDDPHQTLFAMGEAIAHLNYLEKQRRLERTTEDGIIRYTTVTQDSH
jgi:glyoxylase-like metal-dependent hydrolase (beta-lactamase superfamily II)